MNPQFRFLTVVVAAHLLCLSSLAQLAPSLLERASTGDATAMHLIGRAALSGGKPVEAYAWFSLAAEYGVETAEKSSLLSALSPAQVTEAARRTEDVRSTQLRGLPPPAKMPVARVVETRRAVEERPVAPPPATPAMTQPALDGQVKEQKAQIARLEADLAAARAEVSDATKQSEERTTQLDAALAKAGQERDALAAEIATLRRDKQRAEESLSQMQARPSLDGQVEAQKAQIAKLETDLATARSETRAANARSGEKTTQLEAALAKAGQEKETLSTEVVSLRQDRLRAEEGRDKTRAELSAVRSKLETDLAAAQTETRVAKQKAGEATKLDAALAQATQERDALAGEIATLRRDKQRAEESLAQIRAQPSLEGKVQEQNARIARLEADLVAAQTETRVANQKAGEATKLEAILAQATQERDALAGEIATLRRDKQRAEESLAQLQAKPSLEGKVQEQTARIARLEADLVAAQTETRAAKEESGKASASLEAALVNAGQEKDALAGEIAALRRDKQRAEESLAQLQAKPSLDGQIEAQKAQIARLETDLAAARSEAGAAKEKGGETTRLEAALTKAGQEKGALTAEIATLRQDRLRAEQARDQLRADNSAARSKLESDLAAAQTEARVAKQKAGEATKLEAALAKATQERDAQVEALRSQIARLEADLAAARSEARSGNAQFGESTNQLESALAKATEERDSLSGELATLRRSNSPEIERLRGELAGAEQARTAALALRDAAIRDLTAEQIRNDNLVRELARARPGMPLVSDNTPRAAPSRSPALERVDLPARATPEPRLHTVAAGENLSVISNRHYGTPNRWPEIFNANRDVMQTQNHLVPGMQLRIP